MVRRSLIAAALVAIASPLAAQSTPPGPAEWTWATNRPDTNAPMGVFGARTLGESEFELAYRYVQMNSRGVWFDSDSLALATTLQLYNDAPLTLSDIRHQVSISYGVSENLTLLARGEFAVLERETIANGSLLRTGAEEFGDLEVAALYNVYSQGPYRLHIMAGAVLPVGTMTTYADTTMAQTGVLVAQPFDMRPSSGSVGGTLGITGVAQNEFGSVGAQFRLRTNFNESSAGTTLGDRYEANGWAAYNLNHSFSASGGFRWESWDNVEGVDTRINPAGDPMNLGALLAGQRLVLPVGLNFLMPEGARFSGHRLSLEAVYTLHQDLEGPQLGFDWGLNFGWSVAR